MPWSDRPAEERRCAEIAIEWALTGEAAELDLDLAIEVRDAMEGTPPEHDRAWRAAAQLVVMCAGKIAEQEQGRADRLPWNKAKAKARRIEDEALVQEAKRMLDAALR